MSRFNNLEFGDGTDQRPLQGTPLVRDDTFYLNEARTAFQNGNFEAALRLFSKVLEYNPGDTAAWTGQVRMLIELGEFHEARLWADKALEKFPREPELLAAKAVALAREGNLQEALALSDASIHQRGDTPYVWLARADVLLASEETRADYCFDKALLLAPGDWVVTWVAARIRVFYRQFAYALALLQKAVELNSSHFLLWFELGKCQELLGLVGPARVSFNTARQLNPQFTEASRQLTRLGSAGLGSAFKGWWRKTFNR